MLKTFKEVYLKSKLIRLLLVLSFCFAHQLLAQEEYRYGKFDSTLAHNGTQFNGIWTIAEIADGNHQFQPNPAGLYDMLVIRFEDGNKYSLSACNNYSGRYYVGDNNEIKFENYIGTSAACFVKYKNGFSFRPGIFADSMEVVNKYSPERELLILYNNDRLVFTLKQHKDYYAPNSRPDMTLLEVNPIRIDSAFFKGEYILIRSAQELKNYGIVLNEPLDFSEHTLLVVKNEILQKNKKILRQMPLRFRLNGNKVRYPVHYSNYYYNPVSEKYYLDIIRSYFGKHAFNRGEEKHSGYILKKVEDENLVITQRDTI